MKASHGQETAEFFALGCWSSTSGNMQPGHGHGATLGVRFFELPRGRIE